MYPKTVWLLPLLLSELQLLLHPVIGLNHLVNPTIRSLKRDGEEEHPPKLVEVPSTGDELEEEEDEDTGLWSPMSSNGTGTGTLVPAGSDQGNFFQPRPSSFANSLDNGSIGDNDAKDVTTTTIKTPPTSVASSDSKSSWDGMDVLVAIFFSLAAIWLIVASAYTVILCVLLRLQARGELDIYDQDLGVLHCCGGRIRLNFGWILRKYAIQLERDHERRLQRQRRREEERSGVTPTNIEVDLSSNQPVRIMTKEERRKAMEVLLGTKSVSASKSISIGGEDDLDEKDKAAPSSPFKASSSPTKTPSSPCSCMSEEGPVCSICLVGYDSNDVVFRSKTCAHMFHSECIMTWLERRNHTECPCCREPLVSDVEVWETVQRHRRERRRQLRRENSWTHRLISWALSNRSRRQDHACETDEDDEDPNQEVEPTNEVDNC